MPNLILLQQNSKPVYVLIFDKIKNSFFLIVVRISPFIFSPFIHTVVSVILLSKTVWVRWRGYRHLRSSPPLSPLPPPPTTTQHSLFSCFWGTVFAVLVATHTDGLHLVRWLRDLNRLRYISGPAIHFTTPFQHKQQEHFFANLIT